MQASSKCFLIIVFLTQGCNSARTTEPPLKLSDPSEIKMNLGLRCSAEGIPVDPRKGLLVVASGDGKRWLVSLANGLTWPKELAGKTIRVTGTATEYRQRTNEEGQAVNSDGRLVQGYGAQPVYFLRNCEYQIVE